MSEAYNCRLCGKELTGVMDIKAVRAGMRILVVAKTTEDCNWRRCRVCRRAACNDCFFIRGWVCRIECFKSAFQAALAGLHLSKEPVVLDFTKYEREQPLNGNGNHKSTKTEGGQEQ
jgi:hypothetical protein